MIKMIKNDKNRLTLATVTQGHVLWLTMYKRTKGCCLCSVCCCCCLYHRL